MKVERMKEILGNLRDDDDIAIVWWDYEEMGDHAEEQGVTLSKEQWALVVKKFEKRMNIDAPLIEYLDSLVARIGTSIHGIRCDHCGDDVNDCNCRCDECDEHIADCDC